MADEKRKLWQRSFFWYGVGALGLILGFGGWIIMENYDYKFENPKNAETLGWWLIGIGAILFGGVMVLIRLGNNRRR